MSGSAITQAEKDKAQKILTEVIKLPDNKMCADCNSLGPRWASMNLGVRCPSLPPPQTRRSQAPFKCSSVAARACVYVYVCALPRRPFGSSLRLRVSGLRECALCTCTNRVCVYE